ncbi:MAG TPA: type VI secretion system baseplate subunit TssG, partial [Luteimonas sp.]|nr:type VI secretion system baseplate subunit TssG [Luteimonas sp.]
ALFYRAWADAQPVVQGDRPDEDRFRFHVGALIGMGPDTGDAVVSTGARYHAGRMLSHARNAEGLRAVLQHAFDVPVQVREFIGEWMPLPDEAWMRLGATPAVSSLGTTAVLGGHVRGAQHRFRLQLGPLDGASFRAFLPGGRPLEELAALVRAYVGDEQAWDVQLVLRAGDVPTSRMGQAGRLGLDTWLGRRSWDLDDARDVVVRPATRVRKRH